MSYTPAQEAEIKIEAQAKKISNHIRDYCPQYRRSVRNHFDAVRNGEVSSLRNDTPQELAALINEHFDLIEEFIDIMGNRINPDVERKKLKGWIADCIRERIPE
jgi:hypothetical protein